MVLYHSIGPVRLGLVSGIGPVRLVLVVAFGQVKLVLVWSIRPCLMCLLFLVCDIEP